MSHFVALFREFVRWQNSRLSTLCVTERNPKNEQPNDWTIHIQVNTLIQNHNRAQCVHCSHQNPIRGEEKCLSLFGHAHLICFWGNLKVMHIDGVPLMKCYSCSCSCCCCCHFHHYQMTHCTSTIDRRHKKKKQMKLKLKLKLKTNGLMYFNHSPRYFFHATFSHHIESMRWFNSIVHNRFQFTFQ